MTRIRRERFSPTVSRRHPIVLTRRQDNQFQTLFGVVWFAPFLMPCKHGKCSIKSYMIKYHAQRSGGKRAKIIDIVEHTMKQKWKWAGHIARMKHNRLNTAQSGNQGGDGDQGDDQVEDGKTT